MTKVLVLVALFGCGKTQAAQAGLSCSQVLQCVGACNNESACTDGCLARGTVTAKATMTAFSVCLVQHGCQSSECATTNCATELTTCAGDVASGPVGGQPTGGQPTGGQPTGGQPTGGQPSSGQLLPALAGRWLGRAEVFTKYDFDGDGNVKRWLRVGSLGMSGHTTYTEQYEERGTARQDGDTLVLEWSNAAFTKGGTERYSVAFVDFLDDHATPKLTKLGCEPTSPDSCSIVLTKASD